MLLSVKVHDQSANASPVSKTPNLGYIIIQDFHSDHVLGVVHYIINYCPATHAHHTLSLSK